jgi:aspartate/tyrosine/aromatic aminotransferase
MELLDGVEPGRARTIVRTMDAVLDSQLRSWSAGRLPITGVYDYLSESIDLIFGKDPEVTDADTHDRRQPVSSGGDGVD